MRIVVLFCVGVAAWCQAGLVGDRPTGIPVSTWVREDIFAGFLTGEMVRFDVGMAKLERELKANPNDSDALAWRGGGKLLRAVRAHESGSPDIFERLYSEAQADFAKAREVAQNPGPVFAIVGGTYTVFADRFPSALRREAWMRAQENYRALYDQQKPYFARLPMHMRGEVLSGLAQAAQRLGDSEASLRLGELVAALPGSVYANRAARWQEQPSVAAKTSLTCQTCHEEGRFDAVIKKLDSGKSK